MAFIDTVLVPLEAEGIVLLDTEKSALMALATNANQKVVDSVASAITNNLPKNGVLALVDGGLKTAVIAAEPTIVADLGTVEHSFIDYVENLVKADLARRSATPAQAPAAEQHPAD